MERQFTVTVAAYNAAPGETVTLDADDPLVKLNVEAGILTLVKGQPDAKYVCPACSEQMKRPPSFASIEELQAHYGEKHPALVAPERS